MRKRRTVFLICFLLTVTFLLSSMIFSVFYMSGVDLRPIKSGYGASPNDGLNFQVGISQEEIRKNLEILDNMDIK